MMPTLSPQWLSVESATPQADSPESPDDDDVLHHNGRHEVPSNGSANGSARARLAAMLERREAVEVG